MSIASKQFIAAKPVGVAMLIGVATAVVANSAVDPKSLTPPPAPASARDFYNFGVRQLADGKLTEAEGAFQGALQRQDAHLQPLALYNLGHARFAIGREQLEKCEPARPARARGETTHRAGQKAIQSAEAALASKDVQQMVAAYLRGRGARKELRAAYDAVYRALEAHRVTLEKWRRALGDFRSAAELNPADTNAVHNAAAVEQALAKLVDSVMQTQTMTLKCAGTRAKLDDLLAELKGKIPKDQMPSCEGDGDEEDEFGEPRLEELIGKREAGTKEGREMDLTLSREEAGSLLDQLKLGGNRPLPMGQGEATQPKDRKLRDW